MAKEQKKTAQLCGRCLSEPEKALTYFAAPAFAGVTLIFFVTKPLRRQRVQMLIVLVVPPTSVLILRRFGLHDLLE